MTSQPEDAEGALVLLETGDQVQVARSRLVPRDEGGFHFSGNFETLRTASRAGTVVEAHHIPLAAEELEVHKRTHTTNRVRIAKRVHERTESVDEPLLRENVEVRRVPVDREIAEPVSIRQEGDTLIIPVLEERLVVRKQLVLKEELHVTRQQTVTQDTRDVTLRSEDVEVTREPVDTPGHTDAGSAEAGASGTDTPA